MTSFSMPLCAYCPSVCILASDFSHSTYQLLSPVCILPICLYPVICLLPFTTRNLAPLCVSCHFAGILIPAFFHSSYQLRFYAHCRPPICFHSPTILYPARVQRYSHITPCGSLNSSVNASFLCTPNQTLYLI